MVSEVCLSLEKLNIDEVNYLSDESVNTFMELRGANMKSLWLDGESLTDESFRNFHKMEKLELLSISFCDNMGSAGLRAISQLSKLGKRYISSIKFINSRPQSGCVSGEERSWKLRTLWPPSLTEGWLRVSCTLTCPSAPASRTRG